MEQDVISSNNPASINDLNAPVDVSNVGRAYHRKRNCKIIVDSPADFAPAVTERLGVRVIPFSYVTPDGEQVDDLWGSHKPHDFYEFMRALDMAEKALGTGSKTLVVSADSPIAKIFQSVGAE